LFPPADLAASFLNLLAWVQLPPGTSARVWYLRVAS
jgi:hypothetical protein